MINWLVSLIWAGLALYYFYLGDVAFGIGFWALHLLSRK